MFFIFLYIETVKLKLNNVALQKYLHTLSEKKLNYVVYLQYYWDISTKY